MTRNFCIGLLIGILCWAISACTKAAQIDTKPKFKLHLIEEPGRILPQFKDRFAGQYLMGNVFDSYYRVDGSNKLQASLMKSCVWKTNTQLVCTPAQRKWANGESITPWHYYEHLKRQLYKDNLSSAKELMSDIKNYKPYLEGSKEFASVGIKLNDKAEIEFLLNKPNADFLYLLSHPVLSPIPKPELSDNEIAREYATGPYKLLKWQRGRSILLERNLEYPIKLSAPPQVEFFFIAEDFTALNMYEKGDLDFLRRIATHHVPRFKKLDQLMTITFFRMDYFGFGPSMSNYLALRKALQNSFLPDEFLKVFNATGASVGCVGLPQNLQEKATCLQFKEQSPPTNTPRIKLHYSKQGGESMARSMEWFQSQWKKHLGINIELVSDDVKILGAQIRKKPPDIFRRGVPLARPTCLAALEIFESTSNDNFIRFKNKSYDRIVSEMRKPVHDESKLKKLCTAGIKKLLNSALLIPLGEVQYFMLTNKKFTGFSVNGLNQLDLSRLSASH